ncbi:MAG TPA: TetR/AcrR family transcriptional regulator [Streptosporangiaceae bacterium]|nr:TetR/AcrR family transcriptional regulator [Streptosporangiaceae bacterium]
MTELISAAGEQPPPRRRNRRGQGGQLREDLITAAMTMIEASQDGQPSLRGIARHVGIAATSVYLHFPDVDHLLAAVVERSFEQLTAATAQAAEHAADPADELRARCRAYCRFALDHPNLYQIMFQADLPLTTIAGNPAATPGRRSFQNLVATVERCLQQGLAPAHDDPFRLASLIWTAEHGIVLARISRPTFPWTALDSLVDEMVDRMMAFDDQHRTRPG